MFPYTYRGLISTLRKTTKLCKQIFLFQTTKYENSLISIVSKPIKIVVVVFVIVVVVFTQNKLGPKHNGKKMLDSKNI